MKKTGGSEKNRLKWGKASGWKLWNVKCENKNDAGSCKMAWALNFFIPVNYTTTKAFRNVSGAVK